MHVLVVGNNPLNYRFFVDVLARAGHTTAPLDETDLTGDLIVVDGLGLDALDLARRVRAVSTIRMLVVSSMFGEIEAKAAGYDGFLAKPTTAVAFLAAVRSLG